MRKIPSVLSLCLMFAALGCVAGTAIPTPIEEIHIPDRSFSDIVRMPAGAYFAVGERSIGDEPWEAQPEAGYIVDGIAMTDPVPGLDEGALLAVTIDTLGVVPEYGMWIAGQEYATGAGLLMNVVTRSGGNEFRGVDLPFRHGSVNGLAFAQDGSLWGAGVDFTGEPKPTLIKTDDFETSTTVPQPLAQDDGFLYGVQFFEQRSLITYGQTLPGDQPVWPLLARSNDLGATWERLPVMSWGEGALNTAHFSDMDHGWIGGESRNGAAFAYTEDGGKTWAKQMMPDLTYVWDMELLVLPPGPIAPDRTWVLGAALGTHYIGDAGRESAVLSSLDGQTWEEMWRATDYYGGAIAFDTQGTGEIGIVQNGIAGDALFTRFSAQSFFGKTNLIYDMEIASVGDSVCVDEPLRLQLGAHDPWGNPIAFDTTVWTVSWGNLLVDPDDAMSASFSAATEGEATIECTEPESGLSVSKRVTVEPCVSCNSSTKSIDIIGAESPLQVGVRHDVVARAWTSDGSRCMLADPVWRAPEGLTLEPDGMHCSVTPLLPGSYTLEVWDGPPVEPLNLYGSTAVEVVE